VSPDVDLEEGWCSGVVDRGRIALTLTQGRGPSPKARATVALSPEEARRIATVLMAAAWWAERAADDAKEVKP
jgi:hypothetical protein